jgi:F-type H+-transporting ATPase subunit delta
MEEIAPVYARSLFEAAQDADKLETVRDQLGEIAEAIDGERQLQVFFFSPYLTSEDKKEGLSKAITGADDLVVNFLELLIENHRMPVIFKIRREFETLWDEENRLLPVTITSAVELDRKTVKQIGDQIAEQTDRKVELSTEVDPDVLGGLVVRVGNTVLDASVRRRLENLRREVARAA